MAPDSLTVVVALLCVLAGCSAIGGQQNGSAAEAETVTPAPVPTISSAPPQGISSDEVDAAVVVANHRAILSGSSYTRRSRVQLSGETGWSTVQTTVYRIAPGDEQFRATADYTRTWGRYNRTSHDVWSDGNRTFIRKSDANGSVDYAQFDYRAIDGFPRSTVLTALFAGLEPRHVTQRGDWTVVSGSVDYDGRLTELPLFHHDPDGMMTARIASAGYVDRIAVSFDATYRDRPTRVRVTIDFSNVGSTTVAEPTWLTEARANRTNATATPVT